MVAMSVRDDLILLAEDMKIRSEQAASEQSGKEFAFIS